MGNTIGAEAVPSVCFTRNALRQSSVKNPNFLAPQTLTLSSGTAPQTIQNVAMELSIPFRWWGSWYLTGSLIFFWVRPSAFEAPASHETLRTTHWLDALSLQKHVHCLCHMFHAKFHISCLLHLPVHYKKHTCYHKQLSQLNVTRPHEDYY